MAIRLEPDPESGGALERKNDGALANVDADDATLATVWARSGGLDPERVRLGSRTCSASVDPTQLPANSVASCPSDTSCGARCPVACDAAQGYSDVGPATGPPTEYTCGVDGLWSLSRPMALECHRVPAARPELRDVKRGDGTLTVVIEKLTAAQLGAGGSLTLTALPVVGIG